ncbi:MAG: DUF3313 family protein [Gammaproteobacteria bacterium]|nr:DUF3313 family protein [Gammaproteobacteria bacterium]
MKGLLLIFLSLFIVACTTAPPPALQTGPDAERTFDGLVRIDNARFRIAWADPEVDFSQYNKVMPGGARFEFRAVTKSAGRMSSSGRRGEYWISDANRDKLIDAVSKVFNEELRKAQGWEAADEVGPDVLIIRGAILDIVSFVPPDMAGRHEIYLSSVGAATLVVEGIDSMSGEVVFRAVERRAADAGRAIQANTVTTYAEVRRWARRNATTVREGLESIHK